MNPSLPFRRTMVSACVGGIAAMILFASLANAAPPPELVRFQDAERIGKGRLARFDTLDFDVYTNQKWERLAESHTRDILVHYPDGHTTRGLDAHIAELKPQFTFAPDTRIREHPVKMASGEWTSVIGVMEGTFSQPMHMPGGKVVAPTGKTFKLQMVTVGHWKGGVMDEEYLFWDNLGFMQQIGLM
jgi:hypothetical protein